MSLAPFHPAVSAWFETCLHTPTEPQASAWPAIHAGRHVLIAAPTGSGKTLAAFLAAIDSLVRQGLDGELADETQVVYVSPLKALSNDIERNLQQPLAGIRDQLLEHGLRDVDIRVAVRTGDTTQAERAAMRRQPPHILVTTPESLYLLLTSDSGRTMLASTRTVIVDEIHALAGTKRGAHLALSLERLATLCPRPIQRIGLSATQKPIADVAHYLTGRDSEDCVLVDTGHTRERDLALELPPAPLEAVMSGEVWEQLYDKLTELVQAHRTTLIFTNTRRHTERVARHLSERLGEAHVTAHHGSLAKESRLDAEQRLKRGELKALVATASLELGIDIGDVDLVCQLGSPRSIATFLQRVGRSGHAVHATPKGRLFPLSRDELVECAALLAAIRRGELDRLILPVKPLDVLSQQIVAEVACREYDEQMLYETFKRAWPYRDLTPEDYRSVVRMLADGFATRRGRQGAYLHRDAVNGRLRARKGARLTALTCGGVIPENAEYQVILEPTETFIGTLNEDFAIESMAGDIFQLGNHSYRIRRIEAGRVRVEDAKGAPPSIPFWFGEAPGRTDELSAAVSTLRSEVETRLGHVTQGSLAATVDWLEQACALTHAAAQQIADHLAAAKGVLGALPTDRRVIFERFFDEAGGMQLVIHAPFGSRINRAWGLSLRKRFCRQFNFELQAAATEDAIVLSLGETHSFPLDEVARYLKSETVRDVLVQALLAAPLFTTRWRWVTTAALAVKRFRGGRKNPAPLQRMQAEDLVAVVFPDQIACAENLKGDREVPDHPLVNQTIRDCLTEAMDIDGLRRVLKAIEQGEIEIIARDLPHPSPLAQEILNARPYAFLDDAPLEERRTQAVMSRRWLDPLAADELGQLDPEAIARVRTEAWPQAENADELHDALMLLGTVTEAEGHDSGWETPFSQLTTAKRATVLAAGDLRLWVAAESLPMLRTLYPAATAAPDIDAPAEFAARAWEPAQAQTELLRGRLQGLGPVFAAELVQALALERTAVDTALLTLEAEGFAMRGTFTPGVSETQWCERRLLARIHRYTVERLRAEIEPVSSAVFLRFLFDWQGLTTDPRPEGPQALAALLEQLEGFEVAAGAWESEILPVRMHDYDPDWLDSLCLAGRVLWARLTPPKPVEGRHAGAPVRSTPIALIARKHRTLWRATNGAPAGDVPKLSPHAAAIASHLQARGASFFDDLVAATGLLRTQVEDAIAELVGAGLVNSDGFTGLRALLVPSERRRAFGTSRRKRRLSTFGIEDAGRWTWLPASAPDAGEEERLQAIARTLLRRYGVVFRRLLEREASYLPPWWKLLRIYRRLEARGEIRGGRFVAGFAGEQYALPEAVGSLRAVRKKPADGELVSISAADPLNLVGILTPGQRVPALVGNRILYRDGVPIAVHVAGTSQFLESISPESEWAARTALLRRQLPAATPPVLS